MALDDDERARIDELERKVAFLLRERTGLGLKEAKDAVEALERQLGGR